ncbi:N-acetylmuramoyl-L-alanine amidase [Listeria seeligeri]|uniref:N-acetylmuramoyl-L-alanine amidase n=1 Tax=Listeria seeligeri TaxID=1640 RepID=UPI0022EB266A|nr:N-acetylmuramoyl-L-alanine amidase [Listeria seeligeri]
MKTSMSRGHSDKCVGAHDILSEIGEAEKVLKAAEKVLKAEGHSVKTFIDRTSTSQNANLNAIVKWHNANPADVHVSVHLNAGKGTGVEVWYYAGDEKGRKLAEATSTKMSKALGLPNRGAKASKDLRFLNSTKGTAILLEVCFVDRKEDATAIRKAGMYDNLGVAVCEGLTGKKVSTSKSTPVKTVKKTNVHQTEHEGKVVYFPYSNEKESFAKVLFRLSTSNSDYDEIPLFPKSVNGHFIIQAKKDIQLYSDSNLTKKYNRLITKGDQVVSKHLKHITK